MSPDIFSIYMEMDYLSSLRKDCFIVNISWFSSVNNQCDDYFDENNSFIDKEKEQHLLMND